MKIRFTALMLALFVAAVAQAAGEGKDLEKQASEIIEQRCTKCHTDAQIKAAVSAGKDMGAIVEQMEQRGAKLTGNEKEVIGIFWKEEAPVKKSAK
ncbi:MAG: cytochrome C [Desulfuromonadales bacterium]|nr:cytochrome C [Desulfuromonadales bacterium]